VSQIKLSTSLSENIKNIVGIEDNEDIFYNNDGSKQIKINKIIYFVNLNEGVRNESAGIFYVNKKIFNFNEISEARHEKISSILRQLSMELKSYFSKHMPDSKIKSNDNKSLSKLYNSSENKKRSFFENVLSKKEIARKVSEYLIIIDLLYRVDDISSGQNKFTNRYILANR